MQIKKDAIINYFKFSTLLSEKNLITNELIPSKNIYLTLGKFTYYLF